MYVKRNVFYGNFKNLYSSQRGGLVLPKAVFRQAALLRGFFCGSSETPCAIMSKRHLNSCHEIHCSHNTGFMFIGSEFKFAFRFLVELHGQSGFAVVKRTNSCKFHQCH